MDATTPDLISIHALREEGDAVQPNSPAYRKYFYPRPPRGGRPGPRLVLRCSRAISIHALREEGDKSGKADSAADAISIHALREEGDQTT